MRSRKMSPSGQTVQYTTWEEWRALSNSPRKNETADQNRNNTQPQMCLMVTVKSYTINNRTAEESVMLGP